MNTKNKPFDRVKMGMALLLVAVTTGCVGYVDDGGYYDGGVVVEPDVTFYGGFVGGGHWHDYDSRGHASWGAAHGGGGSHGRR